MKKRILAGAMATALAATCLAGCGSGSASMTASSTESTSTEASSTATADGELPKVVMYYPLTSIPTDQDKVAEAINTYVADTIGVDLELQVVPLSSYDNQLNLVMAGSEQVDLALVWGENISSFVAKGALLPLNDLLDEYGTDIKSIMGDYLEAGAVAGNDYQIPVNRSLFYQGGVVLRTDILEKYNIDTSVITSPEDLDAVFETIKAGEPNMSMIRLESGGDFMYADFDPLGDNFGVLMNYGQDDEVVDFFATDEFKQECEKHREWFQKGYIASDILTATDTAADQVKAGNLLGYYCTVGPGTAQDKTNQCGYDMTVIPINTSFSYTNKVTTFGWGILNNSKNPEAAMKVLNLMYSDSTFLNMLDWGLEGVHYKLKEGSDRIITFADGVDSSNSGYFHNWSFAFGNQLNAYFWDGTEEDFPEQVQEMNKNALLSKAMGFAYDVTPVKNEYTAVTNVCDQYLSALLYGCIDIDENLPKFQEELKSAGLEKIIAEKTSQYKAWQEANKAA